MPFTKSSFRHCVCLAAILICTTSFAQLPTSELQGVFPSGGKSGSEIEITISGRNLDDTDKLLFSNPAISATQKTAEPTPFDDGPLSVENVFLVSIDKDVKPGRYEVRSHGKYGLSNPRTFIVSNQTEMLEIEPNGQNELPQWTTDDGGKQTNAATELTFPVVANGRSNSTADVDWFRFNARKDRHLLINGYAKRIDSQMDLVITLFHRNGQVIQRSRPIEAGDPLISVQLPDDGEYFIKVHDTLFRTGNNFYYRLDVGSKPHLDFVFPPAGRAGSNELYTVYGTNLPDGTMSNWSVDGCRLEEALVHITVPDNIHDRLEYTSLIGPHQGGIDGTEFRMGDSNPILMAAASAPLVYEEDDNDNPDTCQELTLPCEVAGQFFPKRDVDWFSFRASKGDAWAIDLISHRIGVASDPSLLVQRIEITDDGPPKITDIQFIDDLPVSNSRTQSGRHEFDYRTTDPQYLFTAPADGTYRVMVKDAVSSVKSDPRLVYRLAIRKPKPDFRIVAVPSGSTGSMLLRRGGRKELNVFAFRKDGFDGEITVTCTGLPAGVTSDEIIIGPGNSTGTIILTTAEDAAAATKTIKVAAHTIIDGKKIIRSARYGAALEPFQFSQAGNNVASVRSRIVDSIQACVTDYDPAPMKLTIGPAKSLETSRGGRIKIPYQVKRREGVTSNINGFVIDVPPQTNIGTVNIGGNEKGEFELRFQANTTPGTYSFYVGGFNRNLRYGRNPELYERAKKRQERIGKIYSDSISRTQKTQQEYNRRQSELQSLNRSLSSLSSQKQQADQAVATAEKNLQTARAAVQPAEDSLARQPDDDNLKRKLEQVNQSVEAATKALENSTKAAVQADKKHTDAVTKQNELAKTVEQLNKDYQAARNFQQQAQREKQRADQFANQKRNESNPRNINISVPSNTLTIKVTEFPIKLDAMVETITLKQGEKKSLGVKISRLYDFKNSVSIQTRAPNGVGGISFQNLTIGNNQRDGKLEITAQQNAPTGEHECNVRLQMNFNGQNLTMEKKLTVTILAAEKKP